MTFHEIILSLWLSTAGVFLLAMVVGTWDDHSGPGGPDSPA